MRETRTGMFNPESFSAQEEEARGLERAKARQERLDRRTKMSGPDKIEQESDLDTVEAKEFRLVVADVSDIVDRYAATLAKQKTYDYWNSRSWMNPKKWIARQTSAGLEMKLAGEIKQEILKNKNLLAKIEAKLLGKSKTESKGSDSEEISWEVVDEIIGSLQNEQLRVLNIEGKSKKEMEGRPAIENPRVDAAAAELIFGLVSGDIKSRKAFEDQAENEILPLLNIAGIKEKKMYASNLYDIAVQYREHLEKSLGQIGERFDAKQRDLSRKYILKSLHLKVDIAKQGADIYEKESKGKFRIIERAINWTQNPIFQAKPEWENNKFGRFFNKVAGATVGNPVLYAALGNRAGYMAATGSVALVATASFGVGVASLCGAALGAGVYIGLRAAVERWRDIKRREEEAVLGKRQKEITQLMDAREHGVKYLQSLQDKTQLSDIDKQKVAYIFATLRTQDEHGVNLIGVAGNEGEQYGTTFLAVQDLRHELLVFWNKHAGTFGPSAEAQRQSLENMIAAAQRDILQTIEKNNKDISDEIKKRGRNAGIMGAVITLAAGALLPGAGKLLKMGANKAFETLGWQPKFDTSKVTFTEEIGHWVGKWFGREHYPHYQGNFTDIPVYDSSGKMIQKIGLPQGLIFGKNVNGYISVEDHAGHVALNLPLEANQTFGPKALEALKQAGWQVDHQTFAVVGSPRSATELFNQVKGEHLNNAGFEQVHTRSFLDNGTAQSDFNELRYYVKSDAQGNTIVSTDLLEKGSFRIRGGTLERPDLLNLLKQGKLRFIFQTKEGPLNFVLDEHQQLIIPKGSKLSELLIDPASGKIRSDVLFGSAQVSARADGSLDLDWMNADHGAGMALPAGQPQSVNVEGLMLRPPPVYNFGGPYVYTGYRRETDKKLDKIRNKQVQAELKQENEGKLRQLIDEAGKKTKQFIVDAQILNDEEFLAAAKTFWQLNFVPAAAEAVGLILSQAPALAKTRIQRVMKQLGQENPVTAARLQQMQTAAAGHASGRGAGESGGGGSRETTANNPSNTTPAGERRTGNSPDVVVAGTLGADSDSAEAGAADGETEGVVVKEKQLDKKLFSDIREYNHLDGNKSPHYEFQFAKELLTPPKSRETKAFFERMKMVIANLDEYRLRADNFKDKAVVLQFTTEGPFDPSTDVYGVLHLKLNPNLPINRLVSIIRTNITKSVAGGHAERAENNQPANPGAAGARPAPRPAR